MKSKSEFDAKRYVQLFMAGYVPRSKDEKKFVDKHVAQLHQDVNGNKDDVFKATNVPTHKRPPYHGYEKGHDEKVYESVEQVVEQTNELINELSKDKLLSYITKATKDLRNRSFKAGQELATDTDLAGPDFVRKQKKRGMRQIGIGAAARKLAFGKVSEDAEQIDEASKKEHEYNMDAAQREIDRREAQGEDMTGAKIHPKTYEIIKPKKALKEEMSDAQMAKRERIVKSMKKKSATFEKRYGDKAQDVMYATATKMAMEDLDYVNLEMTDAVADLLEAEVATAAADDKSKVKSLKQMEDQAKKVRDVVKKFPIAPRVESASVIEQLLSQIEEETIVLEFNSGETIEIVGALAESILNIFMELSEDNQVQFEELISESMADFEDALSFIAEAYEGNE